MSISNQKLLLKDHAEKLGMFQYEYYVDAAVIIGLKTLRLKKCQKHAAF